FSGCQSMPPTTAKFYVVAVGRQPGIYRSWDECRQQVDGYPGNKHKSFKLEDEAQQYLEENSSQSAAANPSLGSSTTTATSAIPESHFQPLSHSPTKTNIKKGFVVDENDSVIVYTDGACAKNGRKGASGCRE